MNASMNAVEILSYFICLHACVFLDIYIYIYIYIYVSLNTDLKVTRIFFYKFSYSYKCRKLLFRQLHIFLIL